MLEGPQGVVHLVNMDEALLATASNAAKLRFFVGYAGWSPGQLEHELAFDSWHILPATEELVLAEDTGDIWRKLLLSRQFRAAADRMESGIRDLIKVRIPAFHASPSKCECSDRSPSAS